MTALLEAVRRVRPEAVLEVSTRLGAVIGNVSGPGAFGMMWVPGAAHRRALSCRPWRR